MSLRRKGIPACCFIMKVCPAHCMGVGGRCTPSCQHSRHCRCADACVAGHLLCHAACLFSQSCSCQAYRTRQSGGRHRLLAAHPNVYCPCLLPISKPVMSFVGSCPQIWAVPSMHAWAPQLSGCWAAVWHGPGCVMCCLLGRLVCHARIIIGPIAETRLGP